MGVAWEEWSSRRPKIADVVGGQAHASALLCRHAGCGLPPKRHNRWLALEDLNAEYIVCHEGHGEAVSTEESTSRCSNVALGGEHTS
jgi:hypothetical protein